MTARKLPGQPDMRALASLLSKSEKAQRKLAPGTWQHAMLDENVRALRLARTLLESGDAPGISLGDLQDARRAIGSMIAKTRASQLRFVPGTSHHTLQRRRWEALLVARTAVVGVMRKTGRPHEPRGRPRAGKRHA